MSVVPQEWTRFLILHRAAQIERDVMRSAGPDFDARDLATVNYARACDEMMDLLDRLSVRQVLGRITMLLARRERQ